MKPKNLYDNEQDEFGRRYVPMPVREIGKYGKCMSMLYYTDNGEKRYTVSTIPRVDYWAMSTVWKDLREKRLIKDGFKCKQCGSEMNLVVHHINYPTTAWGDEGLDDLVTLCRECHKKVHSRD